MVIWKTKTKQNVKNKLSLLTIIVNMFIQKYSLCEKDLNTNKIKIWSIYSQEHTSMSDAFSLFLKISLL